MREKATETLLEEYPQWRLWIPVGLGLGISAYFSLPVEPPLTLGWGLVGGMGAFLAIQRWKDRGKQRGMQYFCLVGILWMFLGFSLAATHTAHVHTTLLYRTFQNLTLEGEIQAVETTPRGMRLTLAQVHFLDSRPIPPMQKVGITWRGALPLPGLLPGRWIRGRVTLLPIQPPVAPGSFDFRRHSFFQGLSSRGFLIAPPTLLEKAPPGERPSSLRLWMARVRLAIYRRIESGLPPDEAAIASALIVGEKAQISQTIRQNFSDSGTAHILAISGLHMTLVGGLFFLVFRMLCCGIPSLAFRPQAKKVAATASWLAAFVYLGLSGVSVSSVRAFLMHTMITLAVLWDRVALSMASVMGAATIILLLTPEALISPGFQMSFAAVIALITVYERWRPPAFLSRREIAYLSGLLLSSFVASVATTPFSVHTFQQGSLMGIPANMLAIPLTGFWIMPCAMAALVCLPFGGEAPFLCMMGWGLKVLMQLTETVAHWPGAHLVISPPTTGTLGLLVFGTLWVALWHQRWRFLGLLPMGAAFVWYAITPLPDLMVDAAATCVGVRTEQGAFVTARNRARSAQKAWGQMLGLNDPIPRGGKYASPGLWLVGEEAHPRILVTEAPYQESNPPFSATVQVDLSGNFPQATLTRQRIAEGLGGYGYLRGGQLIFRSVREAVGARPWSFKGDLLPSWKRKNAQAQRGTAPLRSPPQPQADGDKKHA
ncbi:MAG: ComEC/Rec2 family competence protein [Holosporales bacterium]|nr:ComEC/Rec2 family competence protein [Holosporales bacterium]